MLGVIRNLIIVGLLLLLYSCGKTEAGRVDETIYVRHQGADMPAYVHGNLSSNAVLVIVHGAGSFGLSFREESFKSVLEKLFTVVYFDQRGQSMSEGHYPKPDDVIRLMGDDVSALIQVLKHQYGADKSYFLLGHSLGGMIALSSMVNGGSQTDLAGWICVDGALDFPFIKQARKEAVLQIGDEQIDAGNDPGSWNDLINRLLSLDPDSDYDEILKIAGEAMDLLTTTGVIPAGDSKDRLRNAIVINNPVNWLVSIYFNQPVQAALAEDLSLTNRLNAITIPTLFIYGKYDLSVPPAMGEWAKFNVGSSSKELLLFEQSMHHPFYSEPEHFVEQVAQFINNNK